MASPRVTIKDVARASAVSPATVSFVLNDTAGQTIPPATRARVQDAARSLGYVAHGIGRALREGTSRVVLLDVGTLRGGGILEDFILGMSDELMLHGHSLLVQHGAHDNALQTAIAAISPRAVVNIDEPFSAVDPANPEGGWTYGLASHSMTQLTYLAEQGHRRIAFGVQADDQSPHLSATRFRHALEAATTAGIESVIPLTTTIDRASTAQNVAELLRAHPEITAVAAATDEVALRVLAAMHTLGLHARSALAVIGFGDTGLGELWVPALTSVHIDAAGLGRRAAQVALGFDELSQPISRSHVVVRESA
ncbi:LacI family DNA-binding transcriptional regulator [Leifsonia sp. A12D58]|uniref:LacI family DNA-binding transcriptional regulator n=1 Tax=Leifsonia sp. A12D58 TaxID=3397674 RepID=UPI0039E19CCE